MQKTSYTEELDHLVNSLKQTDVEELNRMADKLKKTAADNEKQKREGGK